MPQFDQITFFNQIFWLTFFFISFYFIILKNYLPKLSSALKTRKKKLLLGNQTTSGFNKEQLDISNSSNLLTESILADLRINLSEIGNDGTKWFDFQFQGVSLLPSTFYKNHWSFNSFNSFSSTALNLLTLKSLNKTFIKTL